MISRSILMLEGYFIISLTDFKALAALNLISEFVRILRKENVTLEAKLGLWSCLLVTNRKTDIIQPKCRS